MSSTQVPGRGSGTLDFRTGNQAELEVACSLNFPISNFKRMMIKKFPSGHRLAAAMETSASGSIFFSNYIALVRFRNL